LWEWLHKGAPFTEADAATGVDKGSLLTPALFARLLREEVDKLKAASSRDVHDDSKGTTLPIAEAIVEAYVSAPLKAPWYVDLLNLNLDNHDLGKARRRIQQYFDLFGQSGTRITENLDFEAAPAGGTERSQP
jgi:malate synthase